MRSGAPALAVLGILLAGTLLSGCVAHVDGPAPLGGPGTPPADAPRPTTVAFLDAGINVYHEVFARPDDLSTAAALASVTGAVPVSLSREGDYEARVAADEARLRSLASGTLYAFTGTRIHGISFGGAAEGEALFLDADGHGTNVAGIVAQQAPRAELVFVQVSTDVCTTPDCLFPPSVIEGMEWIAAQDWIDVVVVSLGTPANVPDDERVHAEAGRYLRASAAAAASGKLVVNGAGNYLVPALFDHFNGPPWVVCVGGAEASSRGESVLAAKLVDVVANNTGYLPEAGAVDAYQWRGGTSYSGPVVGATLANALQYVRENLSLLASSGPALAAGTYEGRTVEVTSGMLRDALNATAYHFAPTEWDPTRQPSGDPARDAYYSSLPVVAGPVQMGWGYVDAGLAEAMARALLTGEGPKAEERGETAAFQARWQATREAYWHARL